jgi:amidase
MARTVTDMAKLLDGMVGYDPEDPITAFGPRHIPKTYTAFLDTKGLLGARIGAIREPIGGNSRPEADDFQRVEAVFVKALGELRAAGATVMDVIIPDLKRLSAKRATDAALTEEALAVYLRRNPDSEFKTRADIDNHPEMPKTFKAISGQRSRRGGANLATTDPALLLESQRAREQLLQNIAQVMADQKLDVLVFKSVEHEPTPIVEATTPPYKSNGGVVSLNTFLIHTPIITVPMGTSDGSIPAGITFMGLPFSEPTLIRLGYAYEQATRHRRPPATTPPLP